MRIVVAWPPGGADGHTILATVDMIVSTPHLQKLEFDAAKELVPVIQISRQPLVLAAHPSLGVHTVAELVRLAKDKPGIAYASSGGGSNQHMMAEWFARATGILEWSQAQLSYIALSVGVAGFIRGYSGFGFALAAVPMLTVVLDPVEAVPVVLLFEIALTLGFLPSLIGLVQWNALGWLVFGALLGTPIGLYVLSAVPAEPMRFGLGLLLLASVLLSWRTPSGATWHLGAPSKLGIGALSGLLSGGSAMSGPPIVLYFLAVPVSAAVRRASMMMFFLCSASIAVALGHAGIRHWG